MPYPRDGISGMGGKARNGRKKRSSRDPRPLELIIIRLLPKSSRLPLRARPRQTSTTGTIIIMTTTQWRGGGWDGDAAIFPPSRPVDGVVVVDASLGTVEDDAASLSCQRSC